MKRALLKNKNFTLLLAGNAVSLLGSNMQQFALSLYVLAVTGSATIFSTMLSISILPKAPTNKMEASGSLFMISRAIDSPRPVP